MHNPSHDTTGQRGAGTRWRGFALAATTALVLSLGATTAAVAQPAGGMHAMHGSGSIGEMLPQILARAKASLNLNTMQQGMWESAVAASKAAREAARANRAQVKGALQADIAKPAPDLAAVATLADGGEQQNRALRLPVRDQWLALYATFSPEQKATVADLIRKRLADAESFRAKMMNGIREHLGAPAG